jgi:hypothetical protein
MRNLSLSRSRFTSLPSAKSNVSAIAFDLDYDALYVASEHQNFDADVDIELYKLENVGGDGVCDVSFILQLSQISCFSTFCVPASYSCQR